MSTTTHGQPTPSGVRLVLHTLDGGSTTEVLFDTANEARRHLLQMLLILNEGQHWSRRFKAVGGINHGSLTRSGTGVPIHYDIEEIV